MTVGQYEYVTDLNKGSYGVVSLVRDRKQDGCLLALKCINTPDEANQEVESHKILGDHANIAKLYDHFEDGEKYYLVMEYCGGGDLYEAIRGGRGPFQQGNIKKFMSQLIDALIYSHKKGIYHRDIKPENILIGSDGSVKLADWGLATCNKFCTDFGVGSERYMAPELFDEENVEEYDAEKVDIWSVGICLLNILFGRNPFTSASQNDKLFLDFASNREALFDIFPTLSFDTFAVLRHCLTIDPDNRSLENMKNELDNVEFWTTDEEELDMLLDENYYDYDEEVVDNENDNNEEMLPDIITTTVNRQPLRTPSVLVDEFEQEQQDGYFEKQQDYTKNLDIDDVDNNNNWLRTMQFTPPTRQFHAPPGVLQKSHDHRNKYYQRSNLNSMQSVEEIEEEYNDNSNDEDILGSISSDQEENVFHMEGEEDDIEKICNDFSAMKTTSAAIDIIQDSKKRNADDSSSIESVPSLVQSTISSTDNNNTNKSAANPGLPTASIPAFSSLPTNKNFLKFGKSWSDLDDMNDDDDDLFNYDFLGLRQKKSTVPSSSSFAPNFVRQK